MAWYRAGGGGIPAALKTGMNDVLNKKFGTSTTYAPNTWPDNVNLLGKLPEKTVSGAIAYITDGADRVPVKNWQVTLGASLEGVSSVGVVSAGKNIVDFSEHINASSGGFTFSKVANGGISFSTASAGSWAYVTSEFDFFIPKNTTITFSRDTAFSFRHYVRLTYKDGNTQNVYINADATSATITTSEEVTAIRLYMSQLTQGESYSGTVYLMIEVGSTATAYEPYVSTTHTVNLGRTIYGGTVDVVNGTGTETYGKTSLDDKPFNYLSNITRFNVAISGASSSGYKDDIVIPTEYTISHMLITNAANAPDMTMCMYNGSLYIKNLSCTSQAELQTALNGEYLIYPLATSTDFTFTPITPTPETALGVNNFWADANSTSEVTYRRDIDLALGGG